MTTSQQGIDAAIAAEVRAHLARRRISGRKLAKQLAWTPIYLSRRVSGQVPFSAAEILRIARVLDVPVESFFIVPAEEINALYFRMAAGLRESLGLAA